MTHQEEYAHINNIKALKASIANHTAKLAENFSQKRAAFIEQKKSELANAEAAYRQANDLPPVEQVEVGYTVQFEDGRTETRICETFDTYEEAVASLEGVNVKGGFDGSTSVSNYGLLGKWRFFHEGEFLPF